MKRIRVIAILGVISSIISNMYFGYRVVAEKLKKSYLISVHAIPIAAIMATVVLWLLLTLILALILVFMRQSITFLDVFTASAISLFGYTIYYILFTLTYRSGIIYLKKILYLIFCVGIAGILIALSLKKLVNIDIKKAILVGIITTLVIYAIEIAVV